MGFGPLRLVSWRAEVCGGPNVVGGRLHREHFDHGKGAVENRYRHWARDDAVRSRIRSGNRTHEIESARAVVYRSPVPAQANKGVQLLADGLVSIIAQNAQVRCVRSD